jgi:Concanavalin A-like lectin/glucanases superfamily
MARKFVKTNLDVITFSSLPNLTTLSFSIWYNNSTLPQGSPNRFAFVYKGNGLITDINYYFYLDDTTFTMVATSAPSTYIFQLFSMTPDTGVWHHIGVSSDFTTAGTIMTLDGVSKTLGAGANGTPELTATTTLFGRTGIANTDLFNGIAADVGLWSVRLSLSELVALSKGARPYQVREQSLVGYWPFDGLQSPEPDLSGFKQNGTLTGTVSAFGPPIMPFTPRWPQYWFPSPPASILSPASQHTHFSKRVTVVGY